MEERHLSLSEAAEALDISERTAYRWVKSGKLKAYKPGRDYWIPESALTELVEGSEVRPKAPASSQPSFNGLLEEEQRPAILARGVADTANKWDATVSDPDASVQRISGVVDAALDLGMALAEQLGSPKVEYSAEEWEGILLVSRLLKISKAGNKRILDSGPEKQVNRRREQMRELTRRISA